MSTVFFDYDYFADKQAKAIEYNLVFVESPREVNTHGAVGPATIAASSAPPNLEQALKNTLPDSKLGNNIQSASPATGPVSFLILTDSASIATSNAKGPWNKALPSSPA
jgi:hypothetical protein